MRMFSWNMPLVLADNGVQMKLENRYHLLPLSYQRALLSKLIPYFLLLIMGSVILSVINISELKEPLTGKDEQSSGMKVDRMLLLKMWVVWMYLSHNVDFSFKLESWWVLNSWNTDLPKLISINMNKFAMRVMQCFEKYMFSIYELQVLI